MVGRWPIGSKPVLGAALLPKPAAKPTRAGNRRRIMPRLHRTQAHKHLTLQLVWEEYRRPKPDGYGYSRFCELYQRWTGTEVVLRRSTGPARSCSSIRPGRRSRSTIRRTGESAEASVVRRRARRQQLHLRRSHLGTGAGRLDRLAHPRLRIHRRSDKLVVPDNPRTGVIAPAATSPI